MVDMKTNSLSGEEASGLIQTLEREMMSQLMEDVDYMLRCEKDGDVERFKVNYGCALTAAAILRRMGHQVDVGTWMDGDLERLGYFEVDGEVNIRNGEWVR